MSNNKFKAMTGKSKPDPAKREEVSAAESTFGYDWLKTASELCAELTVSVTVDDVIIDTSGSIFIN